MGLIGNFFSGMSQGAGAGMGYSMSQHFIENHQEKKEQKRFAEEAKEYGMTPEQYRQWLAQQQEAQQMPQGYPTQQLPPSYPPQYQQQYAQPYPQQQYSQPQPYQQQYQSPMPMQDGVYVLAPGQGTRHISGNRMKDAISQMYNLQVTNYYEIEDSPECLTHVCMSRNTTDCPIVALPMNIAQVAFGMDDGYDVNYYYCPDCGELVMDRTTYR